MVCQFEDVTDQAGRNPIILALDVDEASKAFRLIQTVGNRVGFYKVGSELFTRCGPAVVEKILNQGSSVFLDLKFYDIPNTVAKSVSSACSMGVDMLTIHTSGGRRMMEAAIQAAQASETGRPLLLGVTVLTSFAPDELSETGMDSDISSQVLKLGKLAVASGLRGLVCSPQEITLLRSSLPAETRLVTPGIRPANAASDDQKRIMTPKDAILAGADYLVIGRPIYSAEDPAQAAEQILASIK